MRGSPLQSRGGPASARHSSAPARNNHRITHHARRHRELWCREPRAKRSKYSCEIARAGPPISLPGAPSRRARAVALRKISHNVIVVLARRAWPPKARAAGGPIDGLGLSDWLAACRWHFMLDEPATRREVARPRTRPPAHEAGGSSASAGNGSYSILEIGAKAYQEMAFGPSFMLASLRRLDEAARLAVPAWWYLLTREAK